MATNDPVTKEFCEFQHGRLKEDITELKGLMLDIHDVLYKNGFTKKVSDLHTNQKWHWRAIAGLGGIVFCLLGFVIKQALFP